MQTKQPISGSNLYYIALDASDNHPIFQSVFEYQNIGALIGKIKRIELLAFFFEPDKAQLVIETDLPWSNALDKLKTVFLEMHYQHWQKRHDIIADEATVLSVDPACLLDLVMQLHQQPVARKEVAEASLYPWSSDHLYRMDNPPSWINTHKALQHISASSRHQVPYYQQAILKPLPQEFDLEEGTDEDYAVIGRDDFAVRLKAHNEKIEQHEQQADIEPIYTSAIKHVANLYGIDVEDVQSLGHRQSKVLHPLAVWMTLEYRPAPVLLAKFLDLEADQLTQHQRSVLKNHNQGFLDKLLVDWRASVEVDANLESQTQDA